MQVLRFPPSTSRLGIVCRNLNLNRHAGRAQFLDTNLSPDGLVVGHPLLEILRHAGCDLRGDLGVVRVDTENLLEAFPSSVFQSDVHVAESLINLLVGIRGELEVRGLGIPAAL